MASLISGIDDIMALGLAAARQIGKEWGVDMKGCGNLADMQDRLIAYYIKNVNQKPIVNWFGEAQKDQQKTSASLARKFEMALKLFKEIPSKLQGNLKQSYPNISRQFVERADSLKKGECWILVAGEVGAGKSSTINLFLNTQLLPTDALRCTNTIIEIRYSTEKRAVCFLRETLAGPSGKRTKEINLDKGPAFDLYIIGKRSNSLVNRFEKSDLRGIQEFKDCAAETTPDDDDNPYDRIEVYYPFDGLVDGIVIVDTPGIEGGNNVDNRLQKYLSKAFGFIYVINTNTAGGVQQSRLGHLLKTVVNSCSDFSPEASLFVGNKWENVPVGDREAVKGDIFSKLSIVYPGIKPWQIHYMSVSKCRNVAVKHGAHMEEQSVLLEKIGSLIPSCLRQGMTNHYTWLSSFLTRTAYLLRVTGVQDSQNHDTLEKRFAEMKVNVERLERHSDDVIKGLRERIDFEIHKVINTVKDKLRNRDFQDRVCNWEDSMDCPKVEKKWKRTADAAAVRISDRISREIDRWERDSRIFERIDREIVNVFAKEFGLLESQVSEVEGFLSNSKARHSRENTITIVPVKKLFAKKKKIERTYNTLGGAVSCVGMLDTDRKEVRKTFRDYNEKNKARQMAEATVLYLTTILENRDMDSKLRKFFDRFFRDIDEAAKKLPSFLHADQQLIETLRKSIDDATQLREKLPTLSTDCADQHGNLDIFYVNSIMSFDFKIGELDWEGKKYLGQGSFADVFKSQIVRKGRPVALKVAKEEVGRSNVSEILREDRCMRDLRHANIVRYYGAAARKTERSLYWIMVMELCRESLKDYYLGNAQSENRIPGLIPRDHPRREAAVRSLYNHGLDICRGLEHIHAKGYTHRDMKMENILIDDRGVAKITDVGVAKATKLLVKTLDGSPAYMAPEVLLSTVLQTNKIDIYSMSLIFWEMWNGIDLAAQMNKEILGVNFNGDAMKELKTAMGSPSGGWRPSFRSANKPPQEFEQMLKSGWSDDPDKRPSAKKFVEFFEKMLK